MKFKNGNKITDEPGPEIVTKTVKVVYIQPSLSTLMQFILYASSADFLK